MGWYKAGHGKKDTKDSTASFVHNRNRENIKSGETHSTIFGKIARYFADLKLVAFTGDYDDLNGKPSSFPPSSHKHAKSDITDFPSSMPASDVKAWAKSASKPAYNWSEIGSKPSTFPPAAHTHEDYVSKSDISPVELKGTLELDSLRIYDSINEKNMWITVVNWPSGWMQLWSVKKAGSGSTGIPLRINSLTVCYDNVSNQSTFGVTVDYGTGELQGIRIKYYTSSAYGYVEPCNDNKMSLGSSSYKWKQVYAETASISTSDREVKKEISYTGSKAKEYTSTYMDDMQLISLILGLKPCVYKFKDNNSNRPHHGLIAQDVEELLQKLGIKDHAAFIKSPKTKDIEIEEEYTDKDGSKRTGKRTVQEEIPGEYIYGLRYEEFISDIIRFCQILYQRNTELETALEEQKKKAESLEKRIKVLEDIIKQAA